SHISKSSQLDCPCCTAWVLFDAYYRVDCIVMGNGVINFRLIANLVLQAGEFHIINVNLIGLDFKVVITTKNTSTCIGNVSSIYIITNLGVVVTLTAFSTCQERAYGVLECAIKSLG